MCKCHGCKEEFEPTSNRKRCPKCIEKYDNPASVTNNFWQLHPEIANLVDPDYKKEHFRITTKSLIPIDVTCNHCNETMTISPKELLETGDCINCHQYLVKIDKKVLRNQVIDIIQKSSNFEEYEDTIKKWHFTSSQLGLIQEIFAQYYFTTHAHLYNIKQYLSYAFDKIDVVGMPVRDMGTDAIIIHNDETKSLVQIKWKSKKICHNRSVFYGMGIDALNIENLKNLYLFSNSDSISGDLPTGEKFRYILYGTLKNIDWTYFKKNVIRIVNKKPLKLEKIVYRPWQTEAKQFVQEKKVVTISAACGTGKTLFSVGVIKEMGNKYKALIVVPSLQLLSQWFYSLSTHINAEFLLVGSQSPTIDDNMNDVPYMVTTDQDSINNTIKERSDKFIVISTYQSLKLVEGVTSFTTIFVDEAHWTVSQGNKYSLVTTKEFKAKQKIYLTATPKIYHGIKEEVFSMDNEEIYGSQFTYSCRKAIEDGILCDYKVLLGVCKNVEEGYPASQRYQLYSKFLLKCIQDQGLTKVLVASNNHQSSLAFYNEFKKIYNGPTLLMKKNAKSKDKDFAISKLEKGCIVFNVRIFNLGVDIPCLEGVFFNGDKSSATDIVQTASRCLRIFPGKEKAFIMAPAFTGENLDVEVGDFPNVRNTLLSLGAKDTAIWEEIFERSINAVAGKSTKEKRIYCIGVDDVDIGDVDIRIFDKMGKSDGLTWEIQCEQLREFIKQNNRLPTTKEQYWINCQRKSYKKGILSSERIAILNQINGWKWSLSYEDQWYIEYEKLEAFFIQNNRLPITGENCEHWISKQRADYKKEKLSENQIKLLNNIGLSLSPYEDQWLEQYEQYKKSIDENIEISWKSILAKWISTQRKNYKKGKLSQFQLDSLNSLSRWSWDPSENKWLEQYEKVKEFILLNNKLPTAKENNWIFTQRQLYKKGKLSQFRIDLLNSLSGWSWIPSTDLWTINLNKLREFINENDRLPTQKEKIGQWVGTQRRNYKNNKLSSTQIELLENIDKWQWKLK